MTKPSPHQTVTELKENLLKAFQEVRPLEYAAICHQLNMNDRLRDLRSENSAIVLTLKKTLFRNWPYFSGDDTYPVPHTIRHRMTPEDRMYAARQMFESTFDYWAGDYGNLRQDLLRYCIETLKKDLAGEDTCLKKLPKYE